MTQASYSQDEIMEVIAALIEKTTNKLKIQNLKDQKEKLVETKEKFSNNLGTDQNISKDQTSSSKDEVKEFESKQEEQIQKFVEDFKGKSSDEINKEIQELKTYRDEFSQNIDYSDDPRMREREREKLKTIDKKLISMEEAKKRFEDQKEEVNVNSIQDNESSNHYSTDKGLNENLNNQTSSTKKEDAKNIKDIETKLDKLNTRQKQLDKILETDFSKKIVSQILKNEVLLSSLDQYVKHAAASQIQNLQKDLRSFKKLLTPQESQKYNTRIQNIENNLTKTNEKTTDLKEEAKEKKVEEKKKEMETEKTPQRSKSYDISLER
ncbi:hypothetical protein [Halalkalibacter flavus]|uniref:hypothetical protein n=1 Tax=Halalkalibacter flavus TaxID=3090668 RepID=UPI002FC8E7BB